jgi:hypothetical protein
VLRIAGDERGLLVEKWNEFADRAS